MKAQKAPYSLRVAACLIAFNRHKDMSELFFFISGNGILELDSVNHTVTSGSFCKVFPPTRHTIYNTALSTLHIIVVASVP